MEFSGTGEDSVHASCLLTLSQRHGWKVREGDQEKGAGEGGATAHGNPCDILRGLTCQLLCLLSRHWVHLQTPSRSWGLLWSQTAWQHAKRCQALACHAQSYPLHAQTQSLYATSDHTAHPNLHIPSLTPSPPPTTNPPPPTLASLLAFS